MSLLKYVLTRNLAQAEDTTTVSKEHPNTRGKSPAGYKKYVESERYAIGKYAAEHGNKWAVNKYGVTESTVRSFKMKYLAMNKQAAKSLMADGSVVHVQRRTVSSLKRGRKSLLGENSDNKIKKYVEKLQRNGGCVNSMVVLAAAVGIVKKEQPALLETVKLSRPWANTQLKQYGYTKGRSTKTTRKLPSDFDLV